MVDEQGNMPKMKEALLSDAVGTVAGAVTGTSTVTTFVESASGVEAGGRTGLTALTTGVMFLACMFICLLYTSSGRSRRAPEKAPDRRPGTDLRAGNRPARRKSRPTGSHRPVSYTHLDVYKRQTYDSFLSN